MATPPDATRRGPEGPARLRQPYLLVTSVPYHEDDRGRVFVDRLWQHDLAAHLGYLADFTLVAPRVAERPAGWVAVEAPPGARLACRPLPPLASAREALRQLPATARALFAAVRGAEIVHSGVAGWPYPLGWLANPMALVLGRRLVVVVESAPWRLDGGRTGWKARLRARVSEALARFFVNRADLVLVTQPEYRRSLFTHGRGTCHVTPAVWTNEEDVLDDAAAERAWAARGAGPLRVLFAARLVAGKGVGVLLEALRRLDRDEGAAPGAERPWLEVTVLGEGPEAAAVERTAAELANVRLALEAPVPYGPAFFERVDAHHAVVVANLGDEQPRIVFDAFARARPVVAADTAGIAPHVRPGGNGWLVPRGDAEALAGCLAEIARSDRAVLAARGLEGLRMARAHTHRAMHAHRHALLAERFGTGAAEGSAAGPAASQGPGLR